MSFSSLRLVTVQQGTANEKLAASPTRLVALVVLALLTALVTLAASVAPAHAGKGVAQVVGQGDFKHVPGGVAVNQATGDIYVADVGTQLVGFVGGHRMLQYSEDGEFVRAWGWGVATGAEAFEVCTASCLDGIPGAGDGQFSFQVQDPSSLAFTPPQVAVDPLDGSVYVADSRNGRVQKFTASGAYLGQFGTTDEGGSLSLPLGVAVDPTTRDVYVGDTMNGRVVRFTSAGGYVAQIGSPGTADGELLSPSHVAVDSTGRLYVLDAGNSRIQRFGGSGQFDEVFGSGAVVPSPPGVLAIDPATDHLFVAGATADLSATGVVEIDPDGTMIDVHAANTGSRFGGIAPRSSTGQLFVSDQDPNRALMILDDVSSPVVSIDSVSDVGAHGATFHGTVNPQGPPNVNFRFEYSSDGVCWWSVADASCAPSGGTPVGSDTADHLVTETATGLDANTEYRVRLVAVRDFNQGVVVVSGELTFKTDKAAPLVRALSSGEHNDTSAWLGGEVNPQNSPSSYFVEYTLAEDTGYVDSARVPVTGAVDAGSGNEFVPVTQLVTGLRPATRYRFRVVASNEAGATVGPDRIVATRSALPEPPPGRAYEMVSPLDKNGGNIDRNLPNNQYVTSGASTTGDAVAYVSLAQFADANTGAYFSQYRSVRGDVGWTTRAISPPMDSDPRVGVLTPRVWFLSEDLTKAVVSSNAALAPGAELLGGSWGLYMREESGGASNFRLLSTPTFALDEDAEPNDGAFMRFSFAAASADMRHVIFETKVRALDSDGAGKDPGVYQWVDGQVRYVSKLPSGEAVSGRLGSGSELGQYYPGDHAVSDDGARVYFTAAGAGAIYVRENGTETELVSASERAGDDPTTPRPATFLAASADDGSLAFFSSGTALTDDASGPFNLYLWDRSRPQGQRLTNITAGPQAGGNVLGVAGVTDDASTAYFVARSMHAEGAVAGRPNLYVWTRSDGIRHVAALSNDDAPAWSVERDVPSARFRDARVSVDGNRLLFASRARLTAYDNAGTMQIYLYDRSDGRLVCVSCGPPGAERADAWLFFPQVFPPNGPEGIRAPYRLPRNLSADGSKVFFETGQSLVSRDTNGQVDVYMWSDGELSLVSSGNGAGRSEFVDASADGRDVFFTTRDRLVGSDIDDQADVYDARVGGGFPIQEIPPRCVGDVCQGLLTGRPPLRGMDADSATARPPVSTRPAFTMRRLSAAQRRTLAAGGSVTLTVRVGRPGRLSVRGRTRINGVARTVIRAAKRARRAGPVKLRLRLSRQARVHLSRRGRLSVSLKVRATGLSSPRSMSLALVSTSSRKEAR